LPQRREIDCQGIARNGRYNVATEHCAAPSERFTDAAPRTTRYPLMNADRPEPNAELKTGFEPLRVIFAIGALVLGFLVAALQA
jgi:hypothetical protein